MRTLTLGLLFGCFTILVGWEVYLLATEQELISVTILTTAKQQPALPFAVGFLMGHFFWVNKTGEK